MDRSWVERAGRVARCVVSCSVLTAATACRGALPGPGPEQDHLFFGARYLAQGLLDQAEARAELARQHAPDQPEVHNLIGLIARARGDFAAAGRAFKHAIALREDFPEALNNYGELFVAQDEHASACELFDRAITVDPGYVVARANLADCLLRTGELERSRKEYLMCSEQAPDHCGCRLGLGVIAVRRGELGTAETELNRLLVGCPTFGGAHYNLCWVLLMRQRCGEAMASCQAALARDPGHLEAREALTTASACVARQEGLLAVARQDARAHPREAEARCAQATLLEQLGRVNEAWREWAACAELSPERLDALARAARAAEHALQSNATAVLCGRLLEHARGGEVAEDVAWCRVRLRELARP